MAVDTTLEHLLALHVTAANEQDCSHVKTLAAAVPEVTGGAVEVAFVDQEYTGGVSSLGCSGPVYEYIPLI